MWGRAVTLICNLKMEALSIYTPSPPSLLDIHSALAVSLCVMRRAGAGWLVRVNWSLLACLWGWGRTLISTCNSKEPLNTRSCWRPGWRLSGVGGGSSWMDTGVISWGQPLTPRMDVDDCIHPRREGGPACQGLSIRRGVLDGEEGPEGARATGGW